MGRSDGDQTDVTDGNQTDETDGNRIDGANEGVLVLDGDSQCGLSVVRSLGRKGVTVTAGSHRRRSLGSVSRYSDGSYRHPNPRSNRARFVRHLVSYLRDRDHSVVFPVEDHTSRILAARKHAIERTGTVVATEEPDTFDRAFDKGKLFETVADADVPIPETFAPTSDEELDRVADVVDYPVIVKPRCKSHLTEDGYAITPVSDENYVDSAADLREAFRRSVRRHEDSEKPYPIVQEHVPGTTTTTVALADDGEVLTYFQEERLRTYPSSGGNSALLGALSDRTMLTYAERVLDALRWTGPAMVEFMRTPAGEYKLIEVNGRYWGSLPFAIACGVDVPWLHYLLLCGVDPSPLIDFGAYRTDRRQRRLLYEDVKWLGERLGRGDLGALGPFLTDFAQSRHTAVYLDDPLPTAMAFAQAAELGAESVRNRVADGSE